MRNKIHVIGIILVLVAMLICAVVVAGCVPQQVKVKDEEKQTIIQVVESSEYHTIYKDSETGVMYLKAREHTTSRGAVAVSITPMYNADGTLKTRQTK